jgi:hypothetical protein
MRVPAVDQARTSRRGPSDLQIEVSLPDLSHDPATTKVLAFAAASHFEVELAGPITDVE